MNFTEMGQVIYPTKHSIENPIFQFVI